MKYKSSFLIIFILILFFIGCRTNKQPLAPQQKPAQDLINNNEFVSINNQFSFTLFQQINQAKQDSNVFISPFSVSMALGMALNGAVGNTFDQIKSVLGLENYDLTSVNQTYQSYFSQLQNLDEQVILEIANSIWYHKTFNVLPSFLEVNRQYFNAEVYKADFSDPATVTAINNWVKQKTHDKIEKILDYISRDAVLYLLNALYFKGTWQYAFDPNETRDWTFNSTTPRIVKMMFMSRRLPHLLTDRFEMVVLPYGKGNFNMAIMLPHSGTDPNQLIASMDFSTWQAYLQSCQTDSGTVGLPKFKMKFSMILNDLLKEMGMPDAFSPAKADFTKITADGGIFISIVKHKTFVEVNEQGTEAAAVTLIGFERTAADFFEMICDRPFVFFIYEKDSQAILFMGKVLNPPQE